MSNNDVASKTDLWDVRDRIEDVLREEFRKTHARQDVTNGRIQKAELELGRQDERLKNVQREVFNRRRTDPRLTDGSEETNGEGDGHSRGGDRRVSERDVRMFVAGAGALAVAVTFVWKILPVLVKALQP